MTIDRDRQDAAMAAPVLCSVEHAVSVLAAGYGVPDPFGSGVDILTRSLVLAQRAADLRTTDHEFAVAALCLELPRLLDPDHGCRRDGGSALRHLFGHHVGDLVRLFPLALASRATVRAGGRTPGLPGRLISPSEWRRLRRHRAFGDAGPLAVLAEELDPTEAAAPLRAWIPMMETVAAATEHQREAAMLAFQYIALPR